MSVYASIKSDANQQAQANKRASVVKLTSDKLKRQARRDNMKPKEKRERKLKAWILKYIRNFVKWVPFKGYELNIGKKEGKQSYVIWKIKEIDDSNCSLSITVYPHIYSNWPNIISFIPYKLIIKPRLYSYLLSVISGLKYFIENNEKVPKNHFGKHKWFS